MATKRLSNFIYNLSEDGKLGGFLLVTATIISLTLSNSPYQEKYASLWESPLHFQGIEFSLLHAVNDGLMVIFFFLVGMEIKRELLAGELDSKQKAILPMVSAIGGILIPGFFFLLFNHQSKDTIDGWAIPTATDIAFSLGVVSVLGSRVPFIVKIFLTALAIIDDVAAILIIAFFYTAAENFQPGYLGAAMVLLAGLYLLNKKNKFNGWLWILAGILVWYCILKSGIHATVAGVLMALTIPLHKIKKMEHVLHQPVNYLILPVFALANTAISLSGENALGIASPLGIGIMAGLIIGKPMGIFGAAYLALKFKWCKLPEKLTLKLILGVGFTAGIGFTMSVFIASLSFTNALDLDIAKIAIIIGSLLSGIAGVIYLHMQVPKK